VAPHLLTLDEAAERMGIARPRAGRWLKLVVLRREKDIGRPILVRRRQDGIRARYLVNMASLRRWCPDLFDTRDEVLKAASALTSSTNRRLETIDDRLDQLESNLKSLVDQLRLRGLVRST
jgi:hypothetical protein